MTSRDSRADRRVGYARSLIDQGDLDGALSLLEQTLELAPDWLDLLILTGEIRAKLGLRAEAVAIFRHYLDLSTEDRHGAMLHLALLGAAPAPEVQQTSYVRALFDDFAERFDRTLLQSLDYQGPVLIAEATGNAPGGLGTVLDLGCGTGLVGERLRQHCSWLEGVDLSAGMLEKARDKKIYDMLHQADIATFLLEPPRLYDWIIAGDVLNYVGGLENVMTGISMALRSGGRAVLTVEALDSTGGAEGEVMRLLPTLRYGHSAAYVRAMAADARLVVLDQRTEMLRLEAGEPLASHIFTVERPSAGTAPAIGSSDLDPEPRINS
ncbi:MAG: methyltransferase domain-containing protein [Thalassobaculaceae bacterium]|nr:methyltransferase domain-containing protein [Thalassobaculaceae bacterium]